MARFFVLALVGLASLAVDAQGAANSTSARNSSNDYVRYSGRCGLPGRADRVKSNQRMQRAFQELSRMAGKRIEVFSCIRLESEQRSLWNRYGRNSNRVGSPRGSMHVVGTAADIQKLWPIKQQCLNMHAVRNSVMGGVGGVATYSGGAAHLDARDRETNWNQCRAYLGRGSGVRRVIFDDPTWTRALGEQRTETTAQAVQYWAQPNVGSFCDLNSADYYACLERYVGRKR